jgi:hypothetical protein
MRDAWWLRALQSPGEGGGEGDGGDGDGDGAPRAGDGDGAGSSGGKMVSMSQAAFDRLIDDRIGKTAKKIREEATKAEQDRLASLGVDSWDSLAERLKATGGGGGEGNGEDRTREAVKEALSRVTKEHENQLGTLKAETESLRDLAQTLGVRNAVKVVAKELGAYDADEIVDLMAGRFRLNMSDKTVEVLTPGGNPAVGPSGPITVEEAVAEFAEAKPHLFRADAKAGSGKGSSPAAGKRTHYKRSELMGLSREEKDRVAKGLETGEISVDPNA